MGWLTVRGGVVVVCGVWCEGPEDWGAKTESVSNVLLFVAPQSQSQLFLIYYYFFFLFSVLGFAKTKRAKPAQACLKNKNNNKLNKKLKGRGTKGGTVVWRLATAIYL